jgi:arylsulfatase A-like enzyme
MLTSLWPVRHGVYTPSDGLSAEAATLPDLLGAAGYRSYGVQSNGWLEQSFGFQHGFDRYLFPNAHSMADVLGRSSVWPHGERVLEEAARLVEAHDPAAPFLLYVHLMDVHEYAAPPDFKRFGESQRGAYAASILWVDHLLGELFERLDAGPLARPRLVVFTSDHGEAFGENRAQGHARNVHTPVLHVPLFFHMPGRIVPRRVATQVRNVDVVPTILDLAGVPVPDGLDGASLEGLIDGIEEPHRTSYATLGSRIMRGADEQVAINDGAYSLVRTLGDEGFDSLHDQALDPREDANLVELETAEAARLGALLDAHLALPPAEGTPARNVHIDPAIANRLKALGYLQ